MEISTLKDAGSGGENIPTLRPNILPIVPNKITLEIKGRAGKGVRDSMMPPPIPPTINPENVLLKGFPEKCSAVFDVVITEITADAGIIPSRPRKDINRDVAIFKHEMLQMH